MDYDYSSSWLLQYEADAILRLAGIRGVTSFHSLQPKVVQPVQYPDGLIEASIEGRPEPGLFLIEVATYPEERVHEQFARGVTLTWLNRRVLPEALVLVLRRKGRKRVRSEVTISSLEGWTDLTIRCRVVHLWDLDAEDLLATGDPGLMPWVALARVKGRPERVLERCRQVIDAGSSGQHRATLLAVTQVLAGLRYNRANLAAILGGEQVMLESPVIQDWINRGRKEGRQEGIQEGLIEGRQDGILDVLHAKWSDIPSEVETAVRGVRSIERLEELRRAALAARDLESFRAELSS